MKISEKINFEYDDMVAHGAINIVVFGDSVSHGCFQIDEIDYEAVYWNLLRKKINSVRNYVPVNIINSAISGTTAMASLGRMKRDVIDHHPDLVIVCFGLNDVNGELDSYTDSLKQIFNGCTENGIDVIFMTPNMLNTYAAEDTDPRFSDYAVTTAEMQNGGKMDKYIEEAIKVAEECGVAVCNCYGEWKKLAAKGEDITMLLANRINHPTRKMHNLFADMLFDMIFADDLDVIRPNDSGMYKG